MSKRKKFMKVAKQNILNVLADIQYAVYTNKCWYEFIKSFIESKNNDELNKIELILDNLLFNNENLDKKIDFLWKYIYEIVN